MTKTHIFNGALDEGESGDIVLRGVVDQGALGIHPDSPAAIKKFFHVNEMMRGNFMVGDYQREILSGKKHDGLVNAYLTGQRVPDIEIGMRGQGFQSSSNGLFTLTDPLFVIDGLQRVAAARKALSQTDDQIKIRLGATIYFDSTEEWERQRFRTLNLDRTALSPNVHLRNMRPDNKAIKALYELSTRKEEFALHQRIQWGQSAKRMEMLTALGLVCTLTMLHNRFGRGAKNGGAEPQARSLNNTFEDIGVRNLIANTNTFFDVIDRCWGIRAIVYKERAPQIKQNFLAVLAELFTRHPVFWNDKQLNVDSATLKKLQKFSLADPSIKDTINSSGAGGKRLLYQLLLDHVNSGRRTNRLIADIQQPSEAEAA